MSDGEDLSAPELGAVFIGFLIGVAPVTAAN